MIEIIPAIMPQSFSEIEEKMSQVKDIVRTVQIDIMDATITRDATWPYLSPSRDVIFKDILEEKQSMPFWESLSFEVDLMVKDPQKIALDWLFAGAVRLIAHHSSFENIDDLKDFVAILRKDSPPKDSPLYTEIGLAITSKTELSTIEPIISLFDCVQCMGIKEIGLQRQPFDAEILKTITSLREKFGDLIISVDGGVNFETAPLLIKAGANRLVSGSAIYSSDNIRQAIISLQSKE